MMDDDDDDEDDDDDVVLIIIINTVHAPHLCPDCTPPHDVFFQVHYNHQTHKCAYHKQL